MHNNTKKNSFFNDSFSGYCKQITGTTWLLRENTDGKINGNVHNSCYNMLQTALSEVATDIQQNCH
jgi:hypothetical protein